MKEPMRDDVEWYAKNGIKGELLQEYSQQLLIFADLLEQIVTPPITTACESKYVLEARAALDEFGRRHPELR